MAVLYIIILIGVLVFVHEFGHYIAARIFDVKVLSFSIGFGPRLGGFKKGETSWDIRLLPLGGYEKTRVRALAEDFGFEAGGLGAPCKPEYWLKNHAREALAWVKYWMNKYLRPGAGQPS